ncbi:MAG: hypothetical protein AAF716_08775 [Cyanobacteria bacterium P01_D01_bin.1]
MVTSQKEQIQSLIADIERVLGAVKPRTPWIKASETEPQRQMLAQAQTYLISLQQLFEAPGGWGPVDPTTGQLDAQLVDVQPVDSQAGSTADQTSDQVSGLSSTSASSPAEGDAKAESAEDLLQALRTEMQFLKSSALQPLRLEIDSLQSTREALQQEVRTLEEQRSHLGREIERADQERSEIDSATNRGDEGYLDIDEAQLNQFLAVLMERLQENLSVQVTQTLEQMESDHAAAIATISAAAESEQLALRPSREQQIEEMRQLQSRSDQLLVNIDSTLQRMFGTLQSNIDTYQISLNEGIENMHSLGRQGEVIVRSLVDHLTAQLGQTTPPEPTFFSPLQPSSLPVAGLNLAPDSVDAPAESTAATPEAASPVADTVSSLDEILPNESLPDESLSDETLLDETLPDEILSDESWPVADGVSASTEEIHAEDILAADRPVEEGSSLDAVAEVEPETFIREDGTTDVDLLKLDIDRSDQEDELTPDNMMVNAAITNAHAAQTEVQAEAKDPDIEAKVTPTADAAFLSELTIEDLTVDTLEIDDSNIDELNTDELNTDELNTDELNTDELNTDELNTDDSSADNLTAESDESSASVTHAESEIYSVGAQASPFSETETLGKTEVVEGDSEIEEPVEEIEEDDNDVELAAVLPDLGPLRAPVPFPNVDESDQVDAAEVDAAEADAAEGDREFSYLNLNEVDAEQTDQVGTETEIDLTTSEDLLDGLEADNQTSILHALEDPGEPADGLITDLEEPTVSSSPDGSSRFGSRTASPVTKDPLESALVPDEPGDESTDELAFGPVDKSDQEIEERNEADSYFNLQQSRDADANQGSEIDSGLADSGLANSVPADSVLADGVLDETVDNQTEVVLESALTPDLPADEEETEETQDVLAEDALAEETLLTEDDIPLDDELVATLEADNQASVRNAAEFQVDPGELVSDLEEPIVSELSDDVLDSEVFGSRSAASTDAERVESALIPDQPTGEIEDSGNSDDLVDGFVSEELLAADDFPTDDLTDDFVDNEPTVDLLETDLLEAGSPAADLSEDNLSEAAPTEPSTDTAAAVTDYATQEYPVEDFFVEDFSTLGDPAGNLPPTGVEDLLVDDTELLLSLGQPENDRSALLSDELDFSEMSPAADNPLTENQLVEDQPVEDPSVENQPVEDPPVEEHPVEGLASEDLAVEDLPAEPQPDEADDLIDSLFNASTPATSLLSDSPEQPDDSELESSDNSLSSSVVEESIEAEASMTTESPSLLLVDDGTDPDDSDQPADWFLGIDLGTTGLSAVLMDRRSHRMYELCWSVAGDSEASRFRLPAVASIDTQGTTQMGIDVVGPAALQHEDAPLLRSLKPMVKTGIPDDFSGEPWVQWSDQMSLPLMMLQTAISDLLRTLSGSHMSCHAVGLKDAVLRRALSGLRGVIIGYPANWPDTYSFNIREAVLSAGLVTVPDQVFFVEDVIAALLSALPAPGVDIPGDNQQPGLYNCNWSGGTVVVSAGATLTEVTVADLPRNLAQLSYLDFASRSYTYAGDNVDQDIICQLLHLPTQREESSEESNQKSDEAQTPAQPTDTDWASLGLNQLKLPRPGEADRIIRHRLRQRLNDSALGRQALAAAQDLKMMLQDEDEVDVQLGDRTWVITRKDLEAKVFAPYIQRLNRLASALLNQKSLSAQSIKQVICTGGAASLSIISDWLRQKFPNATIIQDTYSGEYSNSCSRVAYGLANLCHYPDVLDANRHRYNDYFLLLELLRALPEQPLPAGGIMHLLAQRGIDVQACQTHLLALIEGHLPPGLVPTEGDRPLISAQSSDIENYRLLAELPLFRKQSGQIYIADLEQGERLRAHLESLLTTKAQALNQPMATSAIEVASEANSV